MRRLLLPLALALLVLPACRGSRIAGPEPGRHRVTVVEIALSDTDLTEGVLGNPLRLELVALKDGQEVLIGSYEGFRGPRALNRSFEIDYDPQSRYEFLVREEGVLTEGRKLGISAGGPGAWIFDGRHAFGSGSSVTFRDEKVE